VNALILGGGGREHALAWAVSRSANLDRLLVAPGNAGTDRIAENVSIPMAKPGELLSFCRNEDVALVLIGPEAPLVDGLADALRGSGVAVFGPGAEGARLEGSKVYAKEFLRAEGIPTARGATVRSMAEVEAALERTGERVAVKADGLAAGKGVVMAENRDEAIEAARDALERDAFGAAGHAVLLEEWLEGEEVSLIALVDGEEVRPLVPSQDHKRAFDGDTGPNTGGMGAYAPFPRLTGAELDDAVASCLQPVAAGFARRGVDYRGVLYAGLMMTPEGLRVLEYNVRFGDPETQVVLPLFDGDLLAAFEACARGELAGAPEFRLRPGAALTIVAASGGYPGDYSTGAEITGLSGEDDQGDTLVFHAGTKRLDDGTIITSGGRVLSVTGLGSDIETARGAALGRLSEIRFDGMFHRNDIGRRGLQANTRQEETV
jgi:phosphoribosylamine--glycine ligase